MSELPDAYSDAVRFGFGDSAALADELLALVLAGAKTATCAPLAISVLVAPPGFEPGTYRLGGGCSIP